MIVSFEYGFCFLHIPKCGGSTVRDQLADLDQINGGNTKGLKHGAFHGLTHEIGDGPQQKAHLPLREIRQYFPDVFAKIVPLHKYAIVREPESRFLSAFSQRTREVHGKFVGEMSAAEIQKDFQHVSSHILDRPDLPAYPYRHFVRQCAFTHLDGSRFVEHVVPMERLSDLLAHLSKVTNRNFDSTYHSNKTVTFRNQYLKKPLLTAKKRIKRNTPLWVYNRMKVAGLKIFTEQGFPSRALGELERAGFRDFVKSHFAVDYDLHAFALSQNTLKVHADDH